MAKQSRVVDRSGRIRSARAIAALASPVRQEIIDTVELLGGSATIAELASQLGRPADGGEFTEHKPVREMIPGRPATAALRAD